MALTAAIAACQRAAKAFKQARPRLVRGYRQHGVFAVLGARTFHRGTDRGRLLARAHPSGQWVEWLDRPGKPRA